ncbi:hypothetical protein T01_1873 [Trichinella spiralis]|uniref:Uncharacterized protein n=1 Tax=Trichinella spiralis TaxID=6334 RepID=A0A0V1BLG3_TRISP|nr:hypothetical protein T01_1873 [Trichinella spiralis]
MHDTVDMMKYSSTLRGYDKMLSENCPSGIFSFHSTVLTTGKLETLSAMLFAVATSLLRIINEKVSTECEQFETSEIGNDQFSLKDVRYDKMDIACFVCSSLDFFQVEH